MKTKTLELAIRAEVKPFWRRLSQPDVETFLEWVQRGRTYCRQCKGSIAPWLEQGIELGVECPRCGKQAAEAEIQRLASEVRREVHRHYERYWTEYQQQTFKWIIYLMVWRKPRADDKRREEKPMPPAAEATSIQRHTRCGAIGYRANR